MRKKQTMRVLCCETDREMLHAVTEQLRLRGFKTVDFIGTPRGGELVLAVLSESFYADDAAVEKLLELIGKGAENVLPLRLDDAPIPDAIMDVLYARNIISAVGRDAAHTAERIVGSVSKKKNRLPLILTFGAVAAAVIAGVLIWRSSQGKTASSAITGEQLAAAYALGLTEEDLAKIEDVVIVGDHVTFLTGEELDAAISDVRAMAGEEAPFIYYDVDGYAVLNENDPDGNIRWYSRDDGQELGIAYYDDLRFIGMMLNLRYLSLALVDVPSDRLPDLRGAEKLEGIAVLSSRIDNLDWLSGASVDQMMIRFTPIRSFTPLTTCENLRQMHLDMRTTGVDADFTAFAPKTLETLSLWFAGFSGAQDLSSLSGLTGLRSLQLLQPTGLRSLSGLEELSLEELEVANGFELQDVSAISELERLTSLSFDDCPSVRDYSPIAGCSSLESIMIYAGWDARLRDASFLGSLHNLREIRLYSIDLPNLDFLRVLGMDRSSLETFDFSGNVRDFSGLSAIGRYEMLGIDLYGGSLERIAPNLADTHVSYLYLRRIAGLDLSALPTAEERLFVYDCDIPDLGTLPENWPARRIQLYDCRALRSLDGLQRLSGFCGDGLGTLEVYHCPNLTDWSALKDLTLDKLLVSNCFTLPSFNNLRMNNLHLESIPELADLEFLDEMEPVRFHSVELAGLDGLKSLEPLRRFRGDSLSVPPQLAEQAEDLVKEGLFTDFSVNYPQGGWNMENDEYALQSLDELDTLPRALLRHVRSVCVAGDQLVDHERYAAFEQDEREIPGPGVIEDIGVFSELTGLRELTLFNQPLTDLNGIQNLVLLESFRADRCADLRDVSALFALQGLREISLRSTAVDSLQGVQNLYELRRLDISHTSVSDLTVLLGLPDLESVTVSAEMIKAIASLDDQTCGFELNIID